MFLLALMFIPATFALSFQQNNYADIQHAVRVNGALPDSSANCNITIRYSNNTILVNFLPMTNQGNYFNYTLQPSQTSIIGTYPYDVSCVGQGLNTTQSFTFSITPGGIDPSVSRTNAISRTIYFVFGLGILLFLGFYLVNNIPVKYTLLLLSVMFFLISINMLFISLQDEVINPNIVNFFSKFTAISFYIFWFIGFLIFALWMITFINTIMLKMQYKKMEKYGY